MSDLMMAKAHNDIYKDYDECEILLVFGKSFNRKEFETHMKNLWPNDNYPNDAIREYIRDLQLDYGITAWWTWRSDDPVFVIGHQDHEILTGLIERNDNLRDIIPKIDWYYVPGMPFEDKEVMNVEIVEEIERAKNK